MKRLFLILLPALLLSTALAQHRPYFVTYNHEMEERDNLEINLFNVIGNPRGGNAFGAFQTELEYGVTGWWSSAVYFDNQITANESSVFTGYRWENRFKLLPREHLINPVFYIEYARVREADKSLREIVGHDVEADQTEPNFITHGEIENELEMKLILSSNVKGWNISENFITEKPLHHAPWEFGYAVGVSRPLSFVPSGTKCSFCRENFQLGAEAYGGLGDSDDLSTSNTSHYLAPVVAWKFADNANLRVSPGFGLNDQSHRFLMRFSLTYEIEGFGAKMKKLFQ